MRLCSRPATRALAFLAMVPLTAWGAPAVPAKTRDSLAEGAADGARQAAVQRAAAEERERAVVEERQKYAGSDEYPSYLLSLSGEFLRGSYVALASPVEPVGAVDPDDRGSILFEARPRFHMPLRSNLRERAYGLNTGDTTDALEVVFTMETHLRMYARESQPVSAPSFRPELTLRFFAMHRPVAGAVFEVMVGGGFGHYSNGQRNCAWQRPAPDCGAPPDDADLTEIVDRDGGSFGNLVHAFGVVGVKRMVLDGRRPKHSYSSDLRFEQHFGLEDFSRLYGRSQASANVEVQSHLRPGILGRLLTTLEFAFWRPRAGELPLGAVRVEGSLHWERAYGFGFFVSVHKGRDPMNIRFVDDIWQGQLGIAVLPGLPLVFAEQ